MTTKTIYKPFQNPSQPFRTISEAAFREAEGRLHRCISRTELRSASVQLTQAEKETMKKYAKTTLLQLYPTQQSCCSQFRPLRTSQKVEKVLHQSIPQIKPRPAGLPLGKEVSKRKGALNCKLEAKVKKCTPQQLSTLFEEEEPRKYTITPARQDPNPNPIVIVFSSNYSSLTHTYLEGLHKRGASALKEVKEMRKNLDSDWKETKR